MNLSIGTVRRLMIAGGSGLVVGVGYLAPMLAAPSRQGVAIALLLGLFAAVGVFLWRATPGLLGTLMAVPVIIAALLVAMSVPLARDGYPVVSMMATGQKNPNSKSSEVWVNLLSEPVQGLRDFEGEGWEKRGDVFISYQKQPSVLLYRGAWGSGATLRFVRHPYSGIAEVSINGKTQRLDLYSETEGFVDVPLPKASVSWKGYAQRGVIVVGLVVFLTAVVITLAGGSATAAGVFALALLAGCGSFWMVKDRSYVGLMEVVAFAASSEPARVEMDAGHGFTPALGVPVKSGAVVVTEFAVPNPADWRLGIEGASLRAFRDLGANTGGESSNGRNNDCAIVSTGHCVYEVQGTGPLRVWLQAGAEQKALRLPAAAESSKRLFLLLEVAQGRIAVSASRAYLQLSPWEHFSSWITALRVVGQDGAAASKLVRVQSNGMGGYQFAEPMGTDGAYRVPPLVRPDTGSFVAMKVFAGLIVASIVLMIAAAGTISLGLTRSYRDGRRLQVLAAVLGCLGWLGLGVMVGWPAIIGWDGFSPYIHTQTGSITLWYGLGYPMMVGGFLLLCSGPLVSVWSVLGTAVLLLGAAELLLRRGSNAASWLAPVLLCLVLPFTAVLIGIMTHLRDTMNGLSLAMFAFCSFYVALNWKNCSGLQRIWMLVGLLLGGAVLSLLRIDNIPTLLVLAGGLTLVLRGFSLRSLTVVVIAAVCWIGVGALVEYFAVSDREGAALDKRLYHSTAAINPLTGMLVFGKGRIPDALYTEIHDTLNKVMDADVAVQRWSPYHIVYWHETITKRGIPSVETNERLRNLYLSSLKADPVLFMKLRLATFGAVLGHEWFEPEFYQRSNGSGLPSFHDHLLSVDPKWQHLSELMGYAPAAHPFAHQLRALLEWQGKIASTAVQLIVCIFVALFFRRNPLSAVVALGEIVRAGVFFLFAPASVFFYLYDVHVLGFLLPMLAFSEQAKRRWP